MNISTSDIKALERESEKVATILKLLAHPSRLKILCYLAGEEKSVLELAKLCRIKQATLSQFLAVLRNEGLVKTRREAQQIFYSIADQKIHKLMTALKTIFCSGK